jgi:isoaspartyl peptidase/L-asparaginase-like protein (Ntn-hydrolase superfamily)
MDNAEGTQVMLALKRTAPIAKACSTGGVFERLQRLIDSLLAIFNLRA